MRFLSIVKGSENAGPPPKELMDAIAEGSEELMKAGTVQETGRLMPSAAGAKVRLADGKVTVIDGPFTGGQELVGGYAFLEVASKEDAIESARTLIELHKQHWPGWEGEVEVRQVTDFDQRA